MIYEWCMYRSRFDHRRWLKVGEAVLVAAVSALIFVVLIYTLPDCKPIRGLNTTAPTNSSSRRYADSSASPGNSTDDDVIAADDVTPANPGIAVEGHNGHGHVLQVGLQQCRITSVHSHLSRQKWRYWRANSNCQTYFLSFFLYLFESKQRK